MQPCEGLTSVASATPQGGERGGRLADVLPLVLEQRADDSGARGVACMLVRLPGAGNLGCDGWR